MPHDRSKWSPIETSKTRQNPRAPHESITVHLRPMPSSLAAPQWYPSPSTAVPHRDVPRTQPPPAACTCPVKPSGIPLRDAVPATATRPEVRAASHLSRTRILTLLPPTTVDSPPLPLCVAVTMPPKKEVKKVPDKLTDSEKKKIKQENKAKANPELAAGKKEKSDAKRERRKVPRRPSNRPCTCPPHLPQHYMPHNACPPHHHGCCTLPVAVTLGASRPHSCAICAAPLTQSPSPPGTVHCQHIHVSVCIACSTLTTPPSRPPLGRSRAAPSPSLDRTLPVINLAANPLTQRA